MFAHLHTILFIFIRWSSPSLKQDCLQLMMILYIIFLFLFFGLEIIRYLLGGLFRLDELCLGKGMDGVDNDASGEDSTPLQDTLF